eukprot:6986989-Pyramimonas_sp.AAC.1
MRRRCGGGGCEGAGARRRRRRKVGRDLANCQLPPQGAVPGPTAGKDDACDLVSMFEPDTGVSRLLTHFHGIFNDTDFSGSIMSAGNILQRLPRVDGSDL